MSPRVLAASPLWMVVMLACAALGALFTDLEWLGASSRDGGGGGGGGREVERRDGKDDRSQTRGEGRIRRSSSNSSSIGASMSGDSSSADALDDLAALDDDYDFHRRHSSSFSFSSAADAETAPASRIRYRHVHGRPYQQRYGFRYMCAQDVAQNLRRPLPHELQGPGIIHFQTEISTSLKVAVVGDSIGVQIGHRLEEAMEAKPEEASAGGPTYSRVVFAETDVDNLVASYPMRGGGTLLSYRINGLLWDEMQTHRRRRRRRQRQLQSQYQQQPPQQQQQHHRHRHRRRHRRQLQDFFKPQPFNRSEVEIALRRPMVPMGNVDVVVQRITFPWIPLDQITYEALEKNTLLASEMFGMETLVYVNFHFTNNVVDADSHRNFLERLEVVRNFTRTYVPPSNSTLKRLLLLDLDRLVDHFNERNARSMGIETTNVPFEEWMLSQTLGSYDPNAKYRKHIGQVCGSIVPNHTVGCVQNLFFVDGLHFCPSTLAGRITGGIACLIECAELDRTNHFQDPQQRQQFLHPKAGVGSDSLLRTCERQCNDKYMSLEPIPTSEMIQWNGTHGR